LTVKIIQNAVHKAIHGTPISVKWDPRFLWFLYGT
jgi:hypothetical protein